MTLTLFVREFRAILRSRVALWITVSYACIVALVVSALWYRDTYRTVLTQVYVLWQLQIQLGLSLAVIPAVTAVATAQEHERRTYDLLLASPYRPFPILLAKAAAVASYMLIVLAVAAPASFFFFLRGGVDFEAILASYAITIVAIIFSVVCTLSVCFRSTKTTNAALAGFVSVVVWIVAPAAFSLLPGVFGEWAGRFVPFVAMRESIESMGESTRPVGAYSAFAGTCSLLQISYLFLYRKQLGRTEQRARKSPRARWIQRFLQSDYENWEILDNPFLRKDLLSEPYGSRTYARATFLLPLVLCLFLGARTQPSEACGLVVAAVAAACCSLILPIVGATAVPREVVQGTFESLRGTTLQPTEILEAKILGLVTASLGVVSATLVSLIILSTFRDLSAINAFFAFLAFLIVLIPTTLVVLLAGTATKQSGTAITFGYIAVVLLHALPAALLLPSYSGAWVPILCIPIWATWRLAGLRSSPRPGSTRKAIFVTVIALFLVAQDGKILTALHPFAAYVDVIEHPINSLKLMLAAAIAMWVAHKAWRSALKRYASHFRVQP
ncbi:MAG: ABC transporter permease [Planctomycetota bacterium]